MTDRERISNLSDVLSSYASSQSEHRMVDNFTDRRQTNDAEIIISLVSAIYNGIAYGNWPWTNHRIDGV